MARRSQRVQTAGNVSSPSTPSRVSERGTKRTISYKDESSDSSEGTNSEVENNLPAVLFSKKASEKNKSKIKEPKSHAAKKVKITSVQLAQVSGDIFSKQNDTTVLALEPTLWVQIIFIASRFLVAMAPNSTAMSSINWLLGMALVCKKLSGPALEVLYHEIPLLTTRRWDRFTDTLSLNPRNTWINYRVKVKRFGFDLAIPQTGLSFCSVLHHTPELRHIGKCDWLVPLPDIDPRGFNPQSAAQSRFSQLFNILLNHELSLRSWSWNFSFAKNCASDPWRSFGDIHQRDIFKRLTTITLAQYSGIPDHATIGSALAALPQLRSLTIALADCFALDAGFWPGLPSTLESLAISYSWIKAEDLLSFLKAKGSRLRNLSLLFNHGLTIAFIHDLATSCPRLVTLHVDAQLWTGASAYWNLPADPPADVIPSWPTTLQSLKLVNITKLPHGFAQTFFQTLLDASARLEDLRTLVIKVGLNIPVRERADFRYSWIEQIEAAYLRRCPDPNPEFYSIASTKASLLKSASNTVHVQATNTRRNTRSSDTDAGSTVDSGNRVGQGLCNTVDISIGSLRPARPGKLFTEDDFLDSEASGDSDWDENSP